MWRFIVINVQHIFYCSSPYFWCQLTKMHQPWVPFTTQSSQLPQSHYEDSLQAVTVEDSDRKLADLHAICTCLVKLRCLSVSSFPEILSLMMCWEEGSFLQECLDLCSPWFPMVPWVLITPRGAESFSSFLSEALQELWSSSLQLGSGVSYPQVSCDLSSHLPACFSSFLETMLVIYIHKSLPFTIKLAAFWVWN